MAKRGKAKSTAKRAGVGKAGKDVNFIMRVKQVVKDDFAIAAYLRGTTMSNSVHQHMIKTVREERERDPGAFADENRRAEVLAEIRRKTTEGGEVSLVAAAEVGAPRKLAVVSAAATSPLKKDKGK